MTILQTAIVFTTWLSIGMIQPVLSLILLERGATLANLPLVIGIYSITVLLIEFPSGVFADVFGRKASFLISLLFTIAGTAVLLFSHSLLFIIIAMHMQGVGRAFSSGSIDALIIDDCLQRKGKEYTSRVTSQLSIFQSLGIAVGALVGGFLPTFGGHTLNLIAKIVSIAITGILCLPFVKEVQPSQTKHININEHLKNCFDFVKATPLIKVMLFCVFAIGLLLITVEIYWQPAFMAVAGKKYTSLLGIISFMGFSMAILGNLLIQKLNIIPRIMRRLYFLLKLLSGFAVIIFAMQSSMVGFILTYGGIYLILGLTDITELTLMNDCVLPKNRASLLSLLSLSSQLGGLAASGTASVFVGFMGYGGVWITGGIMIIFTCGVSALFIHRTETKSK